jgi:hypothetical protein
MAKSKYGYMPCPTPKCGTRLVVKMNERETLSWRCDECDGNGYVKKGEAGYSRWLGVVERAAPDPAPAAKVPASPDKPVPAAPKPPAPVKPARATTVLG